MNEEKEARRQRGLAIVAALEEAYPRSRCALHHEGPFQLLVATMMSAQTTDLAVNKVTDELWRAYPDAAAMAQADPDDVGHIINQIGLWRSKARNLVKMAQELMEEHNGQVPDDLEGLRSLPGVGKKTATAVLGTAFGIPAGVTVDTHMLRINRLLGLSDAEDAEKMSVELEELLPQEHWTGYTHRIIDHGRLVCVARKPRCGVCPIAKWCPSEKDPLIGYRPENDEREPASAKAVSWFE